MKNRSTETPKLWAQMKENRIMYEVCTNFMVKKKQLAQQKQYYNVNTLVYAIYFG